MRGVVTGSCEACGRRFGMGTGRLSVSCWEARDMAGLMVSISIVSDIGIMRDGVKACGDPVADVGPVPSSLDSSSRSLEPPRLGVEA